MVNSFESTLPQQLRATVERFPLRSAVFDGQSSINYQDLLAKIESVGGFLTEVGVQPGDRVALMIDNSIEYVVAFYAIWNAGAIVVPLNPAAKLYEIDKLVTQSGAAALLVEKPTPDMLDCFKQKSIILLSLKSVDDGQIHLWETALTFERQSNWVARSPSDFAQIIYTSGTTGNPKGVLLSHANLMCNMIDIIDYLGLNEEDKILNVLPFHYCYGNSVLHTHFCVGGSVIMAGSMAFPQEIVNQMRTLEATGFAGVPSTFALFLSRSDWAEQPPQLRYLTQAGGPMGKSLTEKLLAASAPTTRLFVMYGQTEAAARISYLPPERITDKLGSVGIPVKQLQLEIRNELGQVAEVGVQGEVYVKGPSVMQGYWQNPQATEQTLIDGWLKTGDLGFVDNDGFIYLVGRNSDMIKVGAHRINPLELEEVINQLDFVKECAVVGIEDELLGQKLRALVVGEESKENLFALKKHCNEYLPAHKMPREIFWVESLPKTASGKIKRHQLVC